MPQQCLCISSILSKLPPQDKHAAKVKSSLARLPETSKHIHPMPTTSEDLWRSMNCHIQSKLELILLHGFFDSIANNSGHNKAYNLKTKLKTQQTPVHSLITSEVTSGKPRNWSATQPQSPAQESSLISQLLHAPYHGTYSFASSCSMAHAAWMINYPFYI